MYKQGEGERPARPKRDKRKQAVFRAGYSPEKRREQGNNLACMGGLDAVVFTAGIGENSAPIRGKALSGMEDLGIVLDSKKNTICSDDPRLISKKDSEVKVFVIPTNEELFIA